MKNLAVFGAGCFWHVQEKFNHLNGVFKSDVGYMGGEGIANYETAEEKGFVEVILIEFDLNKISYEKLLEIFLNIHDPTSLNKQGADVGKRYKSIIFFYDEEQRQEAIKLLNKFQKKLDKKIVTEIKPATKFFRAEEYHQKYFEKWKN